MMASWTIIIEGVGGINTETPNDIKVLLLKFLTSLNMADQDVKHATITYANRDML